MWQQKKTRQRKYFKKGSGLLLLLLVLAVGLLYWGLQKGEDKQAETQLEKQTNGDNLVHEGAVNPAEKKIEDRRRMILDRKFGVLAMSFPVASVYLRPLEIDDLDATVAVLSSLLAINTQSLMQSLRQKRTVVWVKRDIPSSVAEAINKADLAGVYVVEDQQRFYPEKRLAAHALGFVGDSQGLAGAEFYFDGILRGDGMQIAEVLGETGSETESAALGQNGASVVLTLDKEIQAHFEKQLNRISTKSGATRAMGLVMDAESGEILALAGLPSFDPNLFWQQDTIGQTNLPLGSTALRGFRYYLKLVDLLEKGALPLDDYLLEEKAFITIEPKIMKRWVGKTQPVHGPSPWLAVSETLGISPWRESFGMALNEQAPETDEQNVCKPLNRHDLQQYGLPLKAYSNEQQGEYDTPSFVQAVVDFNALVGQAGCVKPHLLKGLFFEENIFLPVRYATEPATGSAEDRQLFVDLISSIAPPAYDQVFAIEMLHRDTPVAGVDALDTEENGAKEQETIPAVTNYSQAAILAAVPTEKPRYVFGYLLEGANLKQTVKSPLRESAEQISKVVVKFREEPAEPQIARLPQDSDELHQQWMGFRTERENLEREVRKKRPQKMPDLLGLSLRSALVALQETSCEIRISGSGQVITQLPGAGQAINESDICRVELQSHY